MKNDIFELLRIELIALEIEKELYNKNNKNYKLDMHNINIRINQTNDIIKLVKNIDKILVKDNNIKSLLHDYIN